MVAPLVDAMVNAAAGMLSLPQRNVAILAVPGDTGDSGGSWASSASRTLLQGFNLQADPNIPVMHATVSSTGGPPPPFMCSLMPPQPRIVRGGESKALMPLAAISSEGGVMGGSSLMQVDAYDDHHQQQHSSNEAASLAGSGGPAFGTSHGDNAQPPPLAGLGGGGAWAGLFTLSSGGIGGGAGMAYGVRGGGMPTSAPDPKRPKTLWQL